MRYRLTSSISCHRVYRLFFIPSTIRIRLSSRIGGKKKTEQRKNPKNVSNERKCDNKIKNVSCSNTKGRYTQNTCTREQHWTELFVKRKKITRTKHFVVVCAWSRTARTLQYNLINGWKILMFSFNFFFFFFHILFTKCIEFNEQHMCLFTCWFCACAVHVPSKWCTFARRKMKQENDDEIGICSIKKRSSPVKHIHTHTHGHAHFISKHYHFPYRVSYITQLLKFGRSLSKKHKHTHTHQQIIAKIHYSFNVTIYLGVVVFFQPQRLMASIIYL